MSKMKSKKFWLSFACIVIMLVQLLGVKINVPYVAEIVNALCAVCVVLGLLQNDTDSKLTFDGKIKPADEDQLQRVCSTGTVL